MSEDERRRAISRLTRVVEAYGSEPERWPQEEREALLALASSDVTLAALMQDAAGLDRLLDELEPPVVSADLMRAVAEIPLRHPAQGASFGSLLPFRSVWQAVLPALLLVGLGAVTGAMSIEVEPLAQDDWDEIAELAYAQNLNDEELAP